VLAAHNSPAGAIDELRRELDSGHKTHLYARECLANPSRTVRRNFGIFPRGGYGRVSELREHGSATTLVGSGVRLAWRNVERREPGCCASSNSNRVQLTVAA